VKSSRTAEAGDAAVAVEGLRFAYRDGFVLEHAGFAVSRGTRVAIVGPSGAGKTTLLHLLAGILLPDAGRVVVDGADWRDLSDAARRRHRISRLGLVFQEFELLDHLTVRENVLLPYFVNGALALDAAVEVRLEALAAAAGIARHLTRRPRVLSQGERQRVALCRALVTRPAILLADEPTGNLDARTARAVVEMLVAEVDGRGATLLTVTHDPALLPSFDRVIELGGVPA